MIAKQVLGLANNGLEVIRDHQAAAAQEAEYVAAIQTPEQVEAANALAHAKTTQTALKVGGALLAFGLVAGGALYEVDKVRSGAQNDLHSIGGFVKGLLPQQTADLQLNNMMHSLTFPAELSLETATGTSTPKIDTHNSVFGLNYTGSTTAVSEAVSVELNVPSKYVAYKPVQVAVTNDAGETKQQWRLQATITTQRDANQSENAHAPARLVSTLEYKPAIDKIIGEQAEDGTIRRIGQVVVGSDADQRLKVATNLGMEGFAAGCAPVLESILPQAAAHAVQQQFASVLAVKDMKGMPQPVVEAINQMTSHAPVVVFERTDGTVMDPADLRIPVTPVDSKQSIAKQLGMDPENVDVANDQSCAMDQNALRNLTTLNGYGK